MNTNKLSDKQYDELSRQLVELQKDVDVHKTQYGYVMHDFDGTTGFDLYGRLNEKDKKYLMHIAQHALGLECSIIKAKIKKGGLF